MTTERRNVHGESPRHNVPFKGPYEDLDYAEDDIVSSPIQCVNLNLFNECGAEADILLTSDDESQDYSEAELLLAEVENGVKDEEYAIFLMSWKIITDATNDVYQVSCGSSSCEK